MFSYTDNMNEPSPYDQLQGARNGEMVVVPDILNLARAMEQYGSDSHLLTLHSHPGPSWLPGLATVAADSCSPAQPSSGGSELASDVLDTMTQAMVNLTTSPDQAATRQNIRTSLLEITNTEGNK